MLLPDNRSLLRSLLWALLVLPSGFVLLNTGFGKEPVLLTPTPIKVVVSPYLSYLPFLIAQEAGYFAEQNIQVEFIRMVDASDATPALIKGDVHVLSFMILPGQFNAMARGALIRIVADKGYFPTGGCTETALMARRTLVETGQLDRPSQLRGRRIAMNSLSSSAGYFVEQALVQGGLTLRDVEIVSLPMTARMEAFQKGTIDLTLVSEPWITRMLQAGHSLIWKSGGQVIPDFQLAFLLYGPALLEKNPDAGKRFMISYLKGVRQYNQGKTAQNVKTAARSTGLDEELLKKTCWPAIRQDGRVNIESILAFQDWAVKNGLLDKVLPSSQFWDPTFIRHADEFLRRTVK